MTSTDTATASGNGQVFQAGTAYRRVLDITPDGRYVLVAGFPGPERERLDRHTGQRTALPFGDHLTANGRAAIGVVDGQLRRYYIETRHSRNLPQPSRDWGFERIASMNNGGTRIGVIANNGRRATGGVFIINTEAQTVKRIDHRIPWRGGTGSVGGLELSADGSIATFTMARSTGGYSDVFVYRAKQDIVRPITRDLDGKRKTGYSHVQSISGNGRFVLFKSDAPNLVPNTPRRMMRYYIRDRRDGVTRFAGIPVSQHANVPAQLNHDGSKIAFVLDGTIGTPVGRRQGPLLGYRDRSTGTTTQLMRGVHGGNPNGGLSHATPLVMDAAGTRVGFTSYATNLTASNLHQAHRGYIARPRP